MKKITLLVAMLFATLSIAQNIKIVEIDADQTSTDDMEFLEILTESSNQSLNGYIVVFYNGNSDQSYRTVDLTGFSSDSNGYFIIGSDLFPGADITLDQITLFKTEQMQLLFTQQMQQTFLTELQLQAAAL